MLFLKGKNPKPLESRECELIIFFEKKYKKYPLLVFETLCLVFSIFIASM